MKNANDAKVANHSLSANVSPQRLGIRVLGANFKRDKSARSKLQMAPMAAGGMGPRAFAASCSFALVSFARVQEEQGL